MRIDEQGRWVSDDGFYVWDETAQTWMLRDQSRPGAATTGASTVTGGPDPAGGVDPVATADPATTAVTAAVPTAFGAAGAIDPAADPADLNAAHLNAAHLNETHLTGATHLNGSSDQNGARTAVPREGGTAGVDTASFDRPGSAETMAYGGPVERDRGGRGPRPPWAVPTVVGVLVVVLAAVLFYVLRDRDGASTGSATAATTVGPSTSAGPRVTSSVMPGSGGSGSGGATAPASPGGTASAPSASGSSAPISTWTGQVEQTWLSSCADAGGDTGYCRCTLKQLEQRFTQTQFLAYNADPNSARTKSALQPVYAACMPTSSS